MRKLLLLLLLTGSTLPLIAQNVIMTGIIDGDEQGGTPKAIELYVQGSVDLGDYQILRFSNGNMNSSATINLSGVYEDTYVYVINTNSISQFDAAFGTAGAFANRITNGGVSGNGDDKFTLESGGSRIDQVGGVIGVDEDLYRDSYMYRTDETGPDGDWVPANWMNVDQNGTLDGEDIANYSTIVPFGTYTPGMAAPTITVAGTADAAEPATDGAFTISLNQVATADVTVDYTLGGTATQGTDYTDPSAGSVTITAGDLSAEVAITVTDDADGELTETIVLTLTSTSDATYALGDPATINLLDDEGAGIVLISTVQGNGTASTLVGQTLTIEGIVVGDYQGDGTTGLGGFFLQEEDADADADPATSEGIWVFQGNTGTDVAVGDLVQVTGDVLEFGGLTELDARNGTVSVQQSNLALPLFTQLDLPLAMESDYEAFEGMLIELVDDLYVTSVFDLARRGSFDVSADQRLEQFTECNEPNEAALAAFSAQQEARTLLIDDGRSGQGLADIRLPDGSLLSATNTLRSGTIFTGYRGVLDERFGSYRVQPFAPGTITPNARPTAAPDVGGNLSIVSMNVENYFTTLGARGADTNTELDRQEAKIVAAICELEADVLGLIEIEDNGTGAGSATQRLLDAIRTECGLDYAAVVSPLTESDDIKVQLIYNTATVEESGTAAALDIDDRNRNPVAQTFRIVEPASTGLGGEITVCVNHFKSKGSGCGAGDDATDGSGNCDGTRTDAANALTAWLATDPTGSGVSEQLIIGDLNAYRMEAPVSAIVDAGFTNLVPAFAPADAFPCGGAPTFVFFGQWGSLDHALSSTSLTPLVTGTEAWEVNASEPEAIDYNEEDNGGAIFNADFYRFSDHNPIVVGVELEMVLPAELAEFTARKENGHVSLTWRTLTEEGVERFDVQRLDATLEFRTIASRAAVGSASTITEYNAVDATPIRGTNVYRLRTVDTDGSTQLSRTVTVEIDNPSSISVERRSAATYLLRDAPRGSVFFLTDARGRTLRTGRVDNETAAVNGAGLPDGVYFLGLQLPDGKLRSFKLLFGR